ncbi:MAG: DUF692 family multinuclear iron-containing protein [Planctomycetota bacterium]
MSHARLGLGIALHPEPDFLRLARAGIEAADFYELSPEMHWIGLEQPSSARGLLLELLARSGKPAVAHGLALSLGSCDDEARLAGRLALAARDQADFAFEHYSEHLGFVAQDGVELALPLALPYSRAAAALVGARLRRLAAVAPRVLCENSAFVAPLGDPALEPAFLNAVCAAAGCGLLLDLHNAYATCLNAGLSLADYLDRLELERVVEVHISGGSESDPAWLPSGRSLRLDTHDGPVPEPVWEALAGLLPRCPALRGVVLERIDLAPAEAPGYLEELRRLRELLAAWPRAASPSSPRPGPALPDGPDPGVTNRHQVAALRSPDAAGTLAARLAHEPDAAARAALAAVAPDALRLTQLIVERLRFERALRGEPALTRAFEDDPRGFSATFRAYDRACAPATGWPLEEARAFRAWEATRG